MEAQADHGSWAAHVNCRRVRSFGQRSADQYLHQLQTKLGISNGQMGAWESFADSLRANRRRMEALGEVPHQPFGALQDRLAARDAMRRAATVLFAVMDKTQQRTAMQLLPLCCLPPALERSI